MIKHIANRGIVNRVLDAFGKYRASFQRYQNGRTTKVARVRESKKDLKMGIEHEKTPNPSRSFLGELVWKPRQEIRD